MSFLIASQLTKTFADGTAAVRGIDLVVERGHFVVLLGPSGCGKTTTLRMVAGLETPTSGRIELAGVDVTSLRPSQRDVGFVFQLYALYPHLTVAENIAFPLRAQGLDRRSVATQVAEVSERLQLRSLLDRRPRQLSGGDQQRVSLARAMVRRPALYLMDEPLGTLDHALRLEMRELVRTQQLELGVTTLYVTHDQEEAMGLADVIVVMDGGRIVQIGAPRDVYRAPANLFTARFVGSPGMNFIRGAVATAAGVRRGGELPDELVMGVRPEHLHLADDGELTGTVVLDEFLGSHRHLYVDTEAGRVALRVGAGGAHRTGDTVRLRVDPQHTCLFDARTEKKL